MSSVNIMPSFQPCGNVWIMTGVDTPTCMQCSRLPMTIPPLAIPRGAAVAAGAAAGGAWYRGEAKKKEGAATAEAAPPPWLLKPAPPPW